MRIHKQQSGFAFVEFALVVVVLAAIGFAGWWVYQKHNTSTPTATNTTPANSSQSPVVNNVSKAPAINSTSDLDAALNTLDQNDPSTANSSDSSQLSSQSNF